VFSNGEVMYLRNITEVDSLNFAMVSPETLGEVEIDSTKQLFAGVVAFNQSAYKLPITSNIDMVKAFINQQTNEMNQTAFAYAVSEGNKLFENEALPRFDKIFMLNFTDGFDNWSNRIWNDESRFVGQLVYDTAQYDLSKNANLNSYAIAFGDDKAYRSSLEKVVKGSGGYYKAATSNDLQTTFNEIAKSMIASAKNVVLQTNSNYYDDDPQYFQLTFEAVGGYTDTIYASLTGTPSDGFTLVIDSVVNGYASFDSPAYGVEDPETLKANIPLNNMKFVKDGKDLQFTYEVKVRKFGNYEVDIEDGSVSEVISKRIAVVLVLDCSSSMGNAFEPMKAAAIDFVETMEEMETDTTQTNIPNLEVPTNEELFTQFKTAYNTYYNASVPVNSYSVALGNVTNFLYNGKSNYSVDISTMMTDPTCEWYWLAQYIKKVSAEQGFTVSSEVQWRYSLAAFFQCGSSTSYNKDFSTAGKPESWGNAWKTAQ